MEDVQGGDDNIDVDDNPTNDEPTTVDEHGDMNLPKLAARTHLRRSTM